MAYGFRESDDFSPILGWELEQVTIDKYHVMFHFNHGWGLLNIAHSFSLRDRRALIRSFCTRSMATTKPSACMTYSGNRWCALVFGQSIGWTSSSPNGSVLTVYDEPSMRSWWFIGRPYGGRMAKIATRGCDLSDYEPDTMSDEEGVSRWRLTSGSWRSLSLTRRAGLRPARPHSLGVTKQCEDEPPRSADSAGPPVSALRGWGPVPGQSHRGSLNRPVVYEWPARVL